MTINKAIYENLEVFISKLLSTPKEHWSRTSRSVDKSGWYGAESVDEAIKFAREGTDVDQITMNVNAEDTNTYQMSAVSDVSGAVVDMGAYLEGIPENMIDFPVTHDPKFMDVLVDVGELCDVSPKIMRNKAIAAACLVDQLESNGYRVRVMCVGLQKFPGADLRAYDYWLLNAITVKRYQEPLSVGQIAGCLHPAFFRRLLFLDFEGHYKGDVPSGYGRQADTKKEAEMCLKELTSVDAILLPNSVLARAMASRNFDLRTVKGAKEWAEYFAQQTLQNIK